MRVGAVMVLGMMLLAIAGGCASERRTAPGTTPPHDVTRDRPLVDLTRLVDPFIGTIGDGNTYPGANAPFGMVQWSPDTAAGGISRPGGYNYGDLIVRGFSVTHLSGAGCVAFGNISFMPTIRPIINPPAANGSPYSDRFLRTQERASPGAYRVTLQSGIGVQLLVTPRTGLGVFTYPAGAPVRLLVDAGSGAGGKSNIDGATNARVRIIGSSLLTGVAHGGHFCGLHNRYTLYFAAQFSRPFSRFGTWNRGGIHAMSRVAHGRGSGAYLDFGKSSARVLVKVGLSYVSTANALRNLRAENPGWKPRTVHQQTRDAWNVLLNRIQVTGGKRTQRTMLYTALYHSLLFPSVFSDSNGEYAGFDGKIHTARGYTQYANFSGWDIYRTTVPLLAWLLPHETSDMMESLVSDAREGGWLPKWPVANSYTGEMNGDSADPILAGAYAFGARQFDGHAALQAMIKGATQVGTGPSGYVERPGLRAYLTRGYCIPESGGWGAAATTLEYAVDDFAIARLAYALHDARAFTAFMRRASNWQRLFNPRTGFIQPRMPDGSFSSSFNPTLTEGYVEGNAWQYTWMTPHDLPRLMHLLGGKRKAVQRLNRFFTRLDAGPESPYYWSGNEPGLEVPWEYNFAGQPWRTQVTVNRIIRTQFQAKPGGLPGNDDLGTMSSWFIWAALGMYPEIPGIGGLTLSSPLFPQTTVSMGNGDHLTIRATGVSATRRFVKTWQLNGKAYSGTWLPLQALHGNTVLDVNMGTTPNIG